MRSVEKIKAEGIDWTREDWMDWAIAMLDTSRRGEVLSVLAEGRHFAFPGDDPTNYTNRVNRETRGARSRRLKAELTDQLRKDLSAENFQVLGLK